MLCASTAACLHQLHLASHTRQCRYVSLKYCTSADADGPPALFQPMVVTGDIDGDGLGCIEWWTGDDDMQEDT
jgi:hypothetical protein